MDAAAERDFEAFVAGSGPRLLRTAVLLVGDRQYAEDLVQVALERTARRWSRLRGVPEAYARVVLVHLVVDRRRLRRPQEVPLEVDVVGGCDPGELVAVRTALLQGLRQLPPRQRAVVVLRYIDGCSEAETAQALGIGVGTVKSSAHRGLERLRAELSDLVQEAP